MPEDHCGTWHYCGDKVRSYPAVVCSCRPNHPAGCDFEPAAEILRLKAIADAAKGEADARKDPPSGQR